MSQAEDSALENRVLLLGATARDAAMTQRVLSGLRIACEPFGTVGEVCRELQRGAGTVVLTEETIDSGEIAQLVDALKNQPPWSDLPMLLLAGGGAGSPFGLKAMEIFHNVTVLERPVQTATLLSVMQTLLRAREWQYQIRKYMRELEEAAVERERLLKSELAARSEAERVSRVKDEFLATLSHELRTPLNAILGWSQLLRAGRGNPGEMEEGLSTIERNARVQTQIIEDLLDMSRIISGRIRLDIQRIDLVHVIEAALDTVRPAAAAKDISIKKSFALPTAVISGDAARLQQVLWNLLSNAIKFTPRHGTVQVVLEPVNSHLRISVVDSGEGIRGDFLPHVFDRFRQADPSTTRRHGGLGLGLAIVKQLVELHGGSIHARSEGTGKGATFSVTLPVMLSLSEEQPALPPPQARVISGAAASPSPVTLKGIKVLVVDDERDARELVRRVLEESDAIVVTASSAAEAMEMIRHEAPAVLVSDIGMPEEDGYSLIRRVRTLDKSRGGNTPALALTAYARSEDRMQAIRSGYQMHLAKPVEPAELTTVVAALAGCAKMTVDSPDESADPAVTI